jgi:hypothetical protein
MSNYRSDGKPYPATPIYEEVVATPVTGVREPGFEPESGASSPDAADRVRRNAAQAGGTVGQTASDVKDETLGVASAAKDAGGQVASVTKDQAQKVVADTMSQARSLYGQATTELSSQAAKQQGRLVEGLRTFGADLGKMTQSVDSGPASELVENLSGRAHRVAEWLDVRSPEEVVHDVRRYAARRPGVFIALAAVTGVVAARLTKALTADAASKHSSATPTGATGTRTATYVGGVGESLVVPEPVDTGYADGFGAATGVIPRTPAAAGDVQHDAGTQPGTGYVGGVR